MVAGRNSMLTLLYPPLPSSTLLYPPPLPALQNLVIFALGLEPAHLLPYFKYLLQNCPAVLQERFLYDRVVAFPGLFLVQ